MAPTPFDIAKMMGESYQKRQREAEQKIKREEKLRQQEELRQREYDAFMDDILRQLDEMDDVEDTIIPKKNQRTFSPTTSDNYGKRGENEVDYALKWLHPQSKFVIIEKRSTNRNGDNCILLQNTDFINEPQEYDHIVLSEHGIFIIETKNYKGKIIINSDGNWIREYDGKKEGERNPVQQAKRHEKLLRSIVGNIPIINIICLSHPKVIIEGIENATLKLLKSDLLCDFIENYSSSTKLTQGQLSEIAQKIYAKMLP